VVSKARDSFEPSTAQTLLIFADWGEQRFAVDADSLATLSPGGLFLPLPLL
jgi:hypothetical protein